MPILNNARLRITKRGAILIGVLAMPIIVYTLNFGHVLSQSHERWAEFGSAMSGIYSPILGLLTLGVLANQYRLQKRLTDHQLNHALIERQIANLDFFSIRLEEYLAERVEDNLTVGNIICKEFQPRTFSILDSNEIANTAKSFNRSYPKIMSTWGAMYPGLRGLEVLGSGAGDAAYQTMRQKLVLIFGYEMCASLDNYYYALTKGQINVNFVFSPLLSKA